MKVKCWWCEDEIDVEADCYDVYVSLRDENSFLCEHCLNYLEGREGYMGYRRILRYE